MVVVPCRCLETRGEVQQQTLFSRYQLNSGALTCQEAEDTTESLRLTHNFF